MMDRFEQLDPIEASLRELAEAEKVDLFRRTSVDVRSLLRSTSAIKRTVRRLSLAAVLVMAATICGWMFTTHTGPSETKTASAIGGCDGSFFGCLTGPTGTPSSGCRGYDYDADGDIDLVDAGTYQVNCNGITR